MSGVPRSQRLIAFVTQAGGGSTNFFAPPEHVVLVKSILFSSTATTTITGRINFYTSDSTIQVALLSQPIASNTSLFVELWVVLNPGDHVGLYFTGGPAAGWLNGAVLLGGPPVAPVSDVGAGLVVDDTFGAQVLQTRSVGPPAF